MKKQLLEKETWYKNKDEEEEGGEKSPKSTRNLTISTENQQQRGSLVERGVEPKTRSPL